ncbi:hypothetical protein M422DRAFT_266388 [Sphaerobolus stellatus SS14]|uniref:Uncharacterized protein n=1 Tax=Sphaerobolus stellatus (strain SS14) TaxID=990650 RepID=A0A0C9V313_SPHS4|nr:hypothetical protein M422DRAFT_266388 [Sphaerobolus stellatus SS14]
MDSGHQIVFAKGMWRGLITNFGNPVVLVSWSPELFVQVLFTGIVSLTAHAFLAHRIWKFSGKKWIFPLALYPLALAKCVSDLVYVSLEQVFP